MIAQSVNTDILVNALDAVSDAVVVCDGAGSVVHANRGARELFGRGIPSSREDVMRHPLAAVAREERLGGTAVVVIPRPGSALTLAQRERQDIELSLAESGWQLAVAAHKLGISRTTLWRRLKQYGLSRPDSLSPVRTA